ncbi:MAG TPA: ketopantoate reductase family protein [Blastocatellia bacterium]|nr:ketopantoate reductase family protein [Blastocatellia bacterium]
MSIEKPARYVIFGAGAIGSAIAGLLARAGSRVVCVARPAYAEALRKGIVIKENGEELTVSVDAVSAARELSPESGDVAFITTKSQATEAAVSELIERYDETLPVVCLQNGVRNEEIAGRRFRKVYAGLVFLSAVQLEPSVIALPQGRSVAIGGYPVGLDEMARDLCAELTGAGFEAMASAYVMSMKWGKLVANLNNATTTITGYWLEQAMSDPEMRRLMLAVREEGLRVLNAAGIAVEPPADEPSPIRIREMTDKLREPPKHPYDPARLTRGPHTYSSMWQDLHLGRKNHEADFLNGDIVALGEKLGIPTPYNSTLLEIVNRMFEEGLRPGLYRPDQLNRLIRSRGIET